MRSAKPTTPAFAPTSGASPKSEMDELDRSTTVSRKRTTTTAPHQCAMTTEKLRGPMCPEFGTSAARGYVAWVGGRRRPLAGGTLRPIWSGCLPLISRIFFVFIVTESDTLQARRPRGAGDMADGALESSVEPALRGQSRAASTALDRDLSAALRTIGCGDAAGLPFRLGLSTRGDARWSDFVQLPPNRDLPSWVCEGTDLSPARVREFDRAHHIAAGWGSSPTAWMTSRSSVLNSSPRCATDSSKRGARRSRAPAGVRSWRRR